MENELAEIIQQIVSEYDSKLPLSVVESLVAIVRLKGDIYPVRYETHFKPFIDIRDRVFYRVSYSNENIMKIESILITGIKENEEEFYLEKFINSSYFNWYWVDEFDKEESELLFKHFGDGRKVIELQPLNQTVNLVLKLI